MTLTQPLDTTLRTAVAEYWAHRSASEAHAADLFAQLAADLRTAGADAVVLDLADRAVGDERRHAETCLAVASHYAGSTVVSEYVTPARREGPQTDDLALRAALHATAFCCIQETIACAWLDACLSRSSEPIVRDALHPMLRDETRHARLGWAHLASARVTHAIRARIAGELPTILRQCLQSWLEPVSRLSTTGAPDHGVPSTADTRRVVLAATRDAVLPGLTSIGIDVGDAAAYLA